MVNLSGSSIFFITLKTVLKVFKGSSVYSKDKESDDMSAEVKRICRVLQFNLLSSVSLGLVCVPVSLDPKTQGLAYSCSCSVGSIQCVPADLLSVMSV